MDAAELREFNRRARGERPLNISVGDHVLFRRVNSDHAEMGVVREAPDPAGSRNPSSHADYDLWVIRVGEGDDSWIHRCDGYGWCPEGLGRVFEVHE